MAGIIAGNLPDAYQEKFKMTTMGLAPEAQLVIMKVFDANGTGRMDSILAAVEDAIALGVDCANLSLGIASGLCIMQESQKFMMRPMRRASTW
ncbi:MAG: S8 family serine peptidase [Oscillospiraceae bacterium]